MHICINFYKLIRKDPVYAIIINKVHNMMIYFKYIFLIIKKHPFIRMHTDILIVDVTKNFLTMKHFRTF